MDLKSAFSRSVERSTAGSRETSQRVISMLNGGKSALYFGDECVTSALLKQAGFEVTALITDEYRAKQSGAGYSASFTFPEGGRFDVIWHSGGAQLQTAQQTLAALKAHCARGTRLVFRALCWLIDPSPDTRSYCKQRFGFIEPLDAVLYTAKQAGFTVEDFYISPRSDWTENLYKPLLKAAEEYSQTADGEALAGMNELKKEADMFELHCEEYSYVYYILKG